MCKTQKNKFLDAFMHPNLSSHIFYIFVDILFVIIPSIWILHFKSKLQLRAGEKFQNDWIVLSDREEFDYV